MKFAWALAAVSIACLTTSIIQHQRANTTELEVSLTLLRDSSLPDPGLATSLLSIYEILFLGTELLSNDGEPTPEGNRRRAELGDARPTTDEIEGWRLARSDEHRDQLQQYMTNDVVPESNKRLVRLACGEHITLRPSLCLELGNDALDARLRENLRVRERWVLVAAIAATYLAVFFATLALLRTRRRRKSPATQGSGKGRPLQTDTPF